MLIVDAKTFLTVAPGTLFQRYDPEVDSCETLLCIKGETIGDNDYNYLPLQGAFMGATDSQRHTNCFDTLRRGDGEPLSFDSWCRDGFYDMGQKYAVWTTDDTLGLIKTLVNVTL